MKLQLAGGLNKQEFILHIIQPGLAGLMDGSVSSLAPLFAAALTTHNSHPPSSWAWRQPSEQASA